MSKEEWSLIGKGQVVDYWNDGEDDNYELRRIHEEHKEEPEAYLVSDIEILRKKLLQDAEDLANGGGDLFYKEMQEAIDRRFGVK